MRITVEIVRFSTSNDFLTEGRVICLESEQLTDNDIRERSLSIKQRGKEDFV